MYVVVVVVAWGLVGDCCCNGGVGLDVVVKKSWYFLPRFGSLSMVEE